MKNFLTRIKNYTAIAFILVQTGIYIAFNVITATSDDPVFLKYSGILLCLIFALVNIAVNGKDGVILSAALLFTAIADLFIFVIDDFYEIGVTSFVIVQCVYAFRIFRISGEKPYISLGLRAFFILLTIIILAATDNLVTLTALVAIYFPMLLLNAVDSVRLARVSKKYILFTVGLVLFVGCDICVGLHNFPSFGIPISEGLKGFADTAMWAFYLPSQVLIVLSGRKYETGTPPVKAAENEK